MIRNATARKMLYDWHGGQWSAFYAAASSGLISHEDGRRIFDECREITDDATRGELAYWLGHQIKKDKRVPLDARGRRITEGAKPEDYYLILPWATIDAPAKPR